MYRLIFTLILLAGFMFGQNKQTEKQKYDEEYYQLIKVMRHYQHEFRTTGITVGLKLVTMDELKKLMPGTCGASLFDISHDGFPMGMILVLRSDQYPKDPTEPCGVPNIRADQENTIVHEFVHFILTFSATEEQTVQIISNIIVPVKEVIKSVIKKP